MFARSTMLIQSCTVFKRFCATQSLSKMLSIAEHLIEEKRFKSAQNQYKQIMDAYPNYADAYDQYFQLQLKTVGPLGLKQSLFNHLQKKYFDAVKKYGEFSEEPNPASTPKC